MRCLSERLSHRLPRAKLHTCAHTVCRQQNLKFKNHILNLAARIRTSIENLTGPKCITVSFSLACMCVCVYVCTNKLCLCTCKWVCVHTLSGSRKSACCPQKRLSAVDAIHSNPHHVLRPGDVQAHTCTRAKICAQN